MKNDRLKNSIGISTFCYVEIKKKKKKGKFLFVRFKYDHLYMICSRILLFLLHIYFYDKKQKESAIIGFSSWNNENQWKIQTSLKSQLEIRFWIRVKQLHRALTDWTLLRIQRGICSMKYIFAFRLILGSAFQFDSVIIVQRGIHSTWNIIYFYLFSRILLLNREYHTPFTFSIIRTEDKPLNIHY